MPVLNATAGTVDLTTFPGLEPPWDWLGLPVAQCRCGQYGILTTRGIVHESPVEEDANGVWHLRLDRAKVCGGKK